MVLIQLGSIETVDFNNRLIETVDFNRFNKFQYRELTTEKLSKSVIVKNVKHGRHRFSFFFCTKWFFDITNAMVKKLELPQAPKLVK